ncbi:MAG: UDP-N-acetylmuramoyl-tripeptide--D-alanyl-D-alanine ligase [Synergistaceae bacterium]|jgi:UDP-N-acetylmuramoyl-tripeptide--D-alanyl-D-alanine ligase|nr:UDP-N-acetylmuramoyl-tripeptide--D-alanyl-D-alanine ligase [Synergistaceae bacterium]
MKFRRAVLAVLAFVVSYEAAMNGDYISKVAMAAAFAVCYAVTSLRDYHMFQLNSYKPLGHIRWMGRNFSTDYARRHLCAVLTLSFFIFNHWIFPNDSWRAVQTAGAFFVMQLFINWPQKAKKPLVYTSRVKRMLAVNALLTTLALIFSFQTSPPLQAAALSLWLICTPLLMLLTNALNSPVESYINRRYIADARRMLGDMPYLTVIGVTGSYGKTSTKYFLQRLLSSKYNVLMTPGNFNTTLGVVRTIRENMRPVHDVFICEMGARYVGDVKEICDLVRPKYGVITSIGPQHLESFGTIENVERTKFELVDTLPEDGAAFLNFDDWNIRRRVMDKTGGPKIVSYSISEDSCDYTAFWIKTDASGSSFMAVLPEGREVLFETKLIGRHNVTNILAAIAAADSLGVPLEDIVIAVRRLKPVPHRLQLLDRGDIIIIDDAYNSNASGARAALDVLGMFDGHKILVTPGMVELGNAQDIYNRSFGEAAAGVCDYVVLVGERTSKGVLDGLRSQSFPGEKIFVVGNVDEAFSRINAISAGGKRKVVLLENDLPDNY